MVVCGIRDLAVAVISAGNLLKHTTQQQVAKYEYNAAGKLFPPALLFENLPPHKQSKGKTLWEPNDIRLRQWLNKICFGKNYSVTSRLINSGHPPVSF